MKLQTTTAALLAVLYTGAATALTEQGAKEAVHATRNYPYTYDSWGAWLKPRLRYLARQCTELGYKQLPSAEIDIGVALAKAGMPTDDVVWVVDPDAELFEMPEDYQTPLELNRTCEMLALRPVAPMCWPELLGDKSPYQINVQCALTTVGEAPGDLQKFGVQSVGFNPAWFVSKVPLTGRLSLEPREEVRLVLKPPQVPESDWVRGAAIGPLTRDPLSAGSLAIERRRLPEPQAPMRPTPVIAPITAPVVPGVVAQPVVPPPAVVAPLPVLPALPPAAAPAVPGLGQPYVTVTPQKRPMANQSTVSRPPAP